MGKKHKQNKGRREWRDRPEAAEVAAEVEQAPTGPLEVREVTPWLFEIPATGEMRVPGRIYASRELMGHIREDRAPEQVRNVAYLPGIVRYSIAMPDIHWGYGFPIGGVAAMDPDQGGVVSPGGIGYDINCGVRLIRTSLMHDEIKDKVPRVIDGFYAAVPAGVGSAGGIRRLTDAQMRKLVTDGVRWAVGEGFGESDDLHYIEESGQIQGADPDAVSANAYKRGSNQLGTLGSGNHFLELQVVDKVYLPDAADRLGLVLGGIAVTIHTGSRGFGYQVCDDNLQMMLKAARKYGIRLPDRQLCCAPLDKPEGAQYLAAMSSAANFAFCNRQVIRHHVEQVLQRALDISPRALGLRVVYDVCHNIGKFEEHEVAPGVKKRLFVHRKGATRAFGPGHPQTPAPYRDIGQPVLIPGDMGRYSFVLIGTEKAMQETWGSSCHGAGRVLSRAAASRQSQGRDLMREMAERGVYVQSQSYKNLAEEMPHAYKDVAAVVDVMEQAGISRIVARLRPIGVTKG